MNTHQNLRLIVSSLIENTAETMAEFDELPDAFRERVEIIVRLHMNEKEGQNISSQVSTDLAVRQVIFQLCIQTAQRDAVILENLMREILDSDSVLLDIVDSLYRDLYAVSEIDEITNDEVLVMGRLEDMLIG